ncbi:MAG: isoprenylcysteine carboxylmethyltransferase family protein [Planctomycetota bacterium]
MTASQTSSVLNSPPAAVPRVRWFFLAPVLLSAAFAAMHVLDKHLPGTLLFHMPGKMVGWGPMLAGGAFCLAGAARFLRRGNNLLPKPDGRTLVTDGVFRISRNPMYLGMTLILVGLAVVAGSATVWLVPPAFAWLIDRQLIRREEAMLVHQFGPAYDDYRRRVRRWV